MLNLPTHPARATKRNIVGGHIKDTKFHDILESCDQERSGYEYNDLAVQSSKKNVIIDLMTIAKPAKAKGMDFSTTGG